MLVDDIITMMYFFRGAISYFDLYETTTHERERMREFLSKRFKEEAAKPASMNRVY